MPFELRRSAETAWDRFVSFCARFSFPFRVLSSLLVFLSGGVASYLLFQDAGLFWVVFVFGIAAFFEVLREKVGDELVRGRTTASRRRDARRLLRTASEYLVPAGLDDRYEPEVKFVRTNLMEHDDHSGRLCVWESFNMEDDDDEHLEIDDTSGVSGYVYHRCEDPVVFTVDDAPADDPRATVDPPEADEAVRDEVRTILSVPIYHPYAPSNPRPGPEDKIGVLNFDSDLPEDELGWDRSETLNAAITISDLIAPTLEH